MKKLATIVLFMLSLQSFSQNNDNLYFIKTKHDSIKFFFDEKGNITTQKNAEYYRLAFIDSNKFDYKGRIEDYTIKNNQKVYECSYQNGFNGGVNCYYRDGKLKYTGFFKNSIKDSLWTFYYGNGVIEKKVWYEEDNPYVKEFYNNKGKAIFTDGNGKYHGSITSEVNFPMIFKISGMIKDGKMDGKWDWSSSNTMGIDYFESGKYIKSNGILYKNAPPVPRIVELIGFMVNENVDPFKFIAIPAKKFEDPSINYEHVETFISLDKDPYLQPLKYKESYDLNNNFSKELVDFLIRSTSSSPVRDYWSLIQFTVTKDDVVSNISIQSNNQNISDLINLFLVNNKLFASPKIGKNKVDCNVYLCVFGQEGKIFIPDYNFNNSPFKAFNVKSDN